MATFSFTTTVQQDQALQWLVDQYNDGHPDAPITIPQYVQSKIQAALVDAMRNFAAGAADFVAKTFPHATEQQKAQILAILRA